MSSAVLSGMVVILVGTAVASWSQVFVPDWSGVLGIPLIAGLCFAAAVMAIGYVRGQGVGRWPALAVSSSIGLIVCAVVSIVVIEAPTAGNLGAIGGTGLTFLLRSGVAYAADLFFLTGALRRISHVRASAISGANGTAGRRGARGRGDDHGAHPLRRADGGRAARGGMPAAAT